MSDRSLLERLEAVVRARIAAGGEGSYVATLVRRGLPKVRSKVQEEAGEVLEASVRFELNEDGRPALVHEAADLIFHLLVLLAAQGVAWEEIEGELARRFGVSGLEEKARRG